MRQTHERRVAGRTAADTAESRPAPKPSTDPVAPAPPVSAFASASPEDTHPLADRDSRRVPRVDSYTPPVSPLPWGLRKLTPQEALDEDLMELERAGAFPTGPGWAVTAANVRRWARHEFWHAFTNPSFLKALGPLDNCPLFILHLDVQTFATLFLRFRKLQAGTERYQFDPEPGPDGGEFLRECLLLACMDYAAGLAQFLVRSRERWGTDEAGADRWEGD